LNQSRPDLGIPSRQINVEKRAAPRQCLASWW